MEICGILQERNGVRRIEMAQFLCYHSKEGKNLTENILLWQNCMGTDSQTAKGALAQDIVRRCFFGGEIERVIYDELFNMV